MAFRPASYEIFNVNGDVNAAEALVGYGGFSRWGTSINHVAHIDFAEFLQVNDLNANVTTAIYYLMIWSARSKGGIAGAQITEGDAAGNTIDNICCRVDGLGGVPNANAGFGANYYDTQIAGNRVVYWRGVARPPTSLANDVPVDLFRKLKGAAANAWKWNLDLCACQQVKPLTIENVQSYFMAAIGEEIGSAFIVNFVSGLSARLPSIMGDEDLRGNVLGNDNLFVKYHTAVSSTPALCHRMLSNFRDICEAFMTVDCVRAIEIANERFWDRPACDAIPPRVRCATKAFLDATGVIVNGWIQGERARGEFPVDYRVFFGIFERANALNFAAQNVADAPSIAELTNRVNAAFVQKIDRN